MYIQNLCHIVCTMGRYQHIGCTHVYLYQEVLGGVCIGTTKMEITSNPRSLFDSGPAGNKRFTKNIGLRFLTACISNSYVKEWQTMSNCQTVYLGNLINSLCVEDMQCHKCACKTDPIPCCISWQGFHARWSSKRRTWRIWRIWRIWFLYILVTSWMKFESLPTSLWFLQLVPLWRRLNGAGQLTRQGNCNAARCSK